MTENTHTFVMPGGSNYTFKMLWQYDSWNRIKLITYPDGEKVTYTYKKYGQLSTVTSKKNTSSTTLISSLYYDKYGNRLKINYGNGTYCNYTYDPVTLRLSTLKSYDKNSKPMQTLSYTYDNVGNITAINNTAVTMPNGMGGPYNYNYTYDDLYRLDSASGSWKTTAGNYNLKMSYSPSGNILQKTLTALTSINGVNINIDKDYSYSYNSAKPHAVTNVFSFAYGYDANGNMTSDCPTRTCRLQAWDEENRLTTVNDKNKSYLSNYLYDAGGERIIKLSGAIQKIMQQNGDIIEFANLGENISINFGAHMVLNNNRYTKHYYIEGQRICSKLGKGFSAPPVGITQSVTPISGNYNDIKTNVLKMLRKGDIRVGFDSTNTTYPASITIVPNSTAAETDRYFYHSDHLGSSSFISNNAGTTTQHLQYLPFGESFVEQKSTTAYLSPYRYSGKEKDEETGYSYFGARYYNPELSVWLSVDPLAEKYPSMSPYMYCAGNPVMLFDPDGREGWPVTRQWSNSDISGFAIYSKTKLQEYKDQKIKDDCANFAVRLVVGYASENGLPLSLKNTAGKTFDSSSDEYQNTEQYLNSVRVGINAQDIPLNTYNINQTETQAGDMEVLHYSINEGKDVDFNHVVIFSSSNKITWGNLNSDGSGAELHNTTGNWVRSSSYNDGVNNKFNVFSGIYNSRWKVLNPANMRSNQQMTKISPLKFKEIQIEKTIIE